MSFEDPLDSLGERIERVIKAKHLNQSSFATLIGANKQNINRVINKESTPNYTLINQILNAIPDLNAEWLTRGVGPMWKDESSFNDTKPTKSSEDREWEDMTIREVGELLKKMKK